MEQSEDTLPALLANDLDYYFKQMILVYQKQLYLFVLRQTRSPQEAEDIVQEALIRAYYALDAYPPWKIAALQLRPWLYKITANVLYSQRRKPGVRVMPLNQLEEDSLQEIEDSGIELPEQELERAELRGELQKLLDALPGVYRAALALYYLGGFNSQEIADLCGEPVGTIKARIHRGLLLLRKSIDSEKVR